MYYSSDQAATFRILPLLQPDPDERPFDMEQVKKTCAEGLSVCPAEDRAWAWLALLKVFPSVANRWKEECDSMVANYGAFVRDFALTDWHKGYVRRAPKIHEFNVEDARLMQSIHGDIVRSWRHLQYFPDDAQRVALPADAEQQDEALAAKNETVRRIERVLYIFGKINVSLKYMQGFNELIMPLYYVMLCGRDAFGQNIDIVEAIVYHAFQNLVTATPIQELYDVQDQAQAIIKKLDEFEALLKKKLPNIAAILEKLRIKPIQYCYRWFNLLFAQEYEMLALLIVWDALLAHQPKMLEYAYYLGLSEILDIETKIAPNEMIVTLQSLQHLDPARVLEVLSTAQGLWLKDMDKKAFKKWKEMKAKREQEEKRKLKRVFS